MSAFIDRERENHGVESICKVLTISPSTYYRFKDLEANPAKRCVRTRRDEVLKPEIARVFDKNQQVYGAHKVWKQLNRESISVARCTVERLMSGLGLEGVKRGKRCITTIPDELAEKPLDLVNRQFTAQSPNQLGWLTSRNWLSGQALSTWLLLWMFSPAISWVGGC